MKPKTSKRVQCLTLTASFTVTTMITLVYTETSVR